MSGMVNPIHHTALMTVAMGMETAVSSGEKLTIRMLMIKGMQLPIYPHAYPLEETISVRAGDAMSTSMAS